MTSAPVHPNAEYQSRRSVRSEQEARLLGKAKSISTARAVVVGAVILIVIGIAISKIDASFWWVALAFLFVFVVLVFVHARAHRDLERATLATQFYDRGLLRLAGKWNAFSNTGERFATENHPYADDLDILGKASLFQLIDTTATKDGEARLASLLLSREADFPSASQRRQEAVRELAALLEFREELAVLGGVVGGEKADPSHAIEWASKGEALGVSMPVKMMARVAPLMSILLLLAGRMNLVNPWAWLLPAILGMAVTGAHPKVQSALQIVGDAERTLSGFTRMFELCERTEFKSELLRELRDRLHRSGAYASHEMNRLERIVGFVDARQNEIFRLFIAPLFWWDLNCAMALDGWRERVSSSVSGWFDALYDLEALSSLASFAFENPTTTFPELTAEPVFEATKLGHPLLASAHRVSNDVPPLFPGQGFVVTGSNMSGKSTFLRTLGINAVLAQAGAPVSAEAMRIGPLEIVTSMRIRDSLDEGVSRFYAELKRLKGVVESARNPPNGAASFFLLDEILHGTNTRERVIGASAILKELITKRALGAVSTHDLALGDLEKEMNGSLRNVHFEEQVVGEKMSFDYKLRQGVVASSNALRLMKIVGIDVVD